MSAERSTVISHQVRNLLEASPAYRGLPEDERRSIASHTVTVANHLVAEEQGLAEGDFPAFVAALIQGTFHAIVDASVQQMHAYADLVRSIATTVDDFRADHGDDDGDRPRVHARQRKVGVAHALRMGINRIVVTDGEIKAR